MAVQHGLAARLLKHEAAKRKHKTAMAWFAISGYGMAAFGFVAGYAWHRFGPLPALILAVAVAGLVLLGVRLIEPYLSAMDRQRVFFLRGGQAEALVAWLLDDLDGGWHVFNTVKLEADSDIDHVLVGPGGLYCISTKSQRGLFTVTPDGLLHNGKPSPFAQQALRQAMNLKDRLAVAMGRDVPWVQSVLAIPFGYIDGDDWSGKVWLVHQDNLLARLLPDDAPKRLNRRQVERVAKVLEMIQAGAADVYRRPITEHAPG